ncbi:MAG: hypothetical protein B6I20_02295 [Bacteroidetes bacterium 4572_117]|nr:MAG: hypothetical protein B6I20_02295 [Bacteroidetes bacterium 4572_117]
MNPQNLIKYYNACYQADNNGISISNFFNPKVENRLVLSGNEEFINGLLPFIPIEPSKARAIGFKIKLTIC